MKTAKNHILGRAVVTYISRMEFELNRESGKTWPGIDKHYGKMEFLNFVYIRHCFAHAGGKLLSNRKVSIHNFLGKLKAGIILDHARNPVNHIMK